MAQKGILIKTPPQDYDDSYAIAFAKQHQAFIVTNDMFRDYLWKLKHKKGKSDFNPREEQKWLKR